MHIEDLMSFNIYNLKNSIYNIYYYFNNNDVKASLVEATSNNDIDSMIDFIEDNIDIDERDDKGRTSLHIAALNGNVEAFDLLVKEGANMNIKDSRGIPLVYYTKDNLDIMFKLPHLDDIDYIDIDGRNLAHWATINGDIKLLNLIHTQKKDFLFSQFDYDGNAPIHYSVLNGDRDIMLFLIEMGVDPKSLDSNGNSPSMLAVIHDKPQCIIYDEGLLYQSFSYNSKNCIQHLCKDKYYLLFIMNVYNTFF